jgi:hypothetical protein
LSIAMSWVVFSALPAWPVPTVVLAALLPADAPTVPAAAGRPVAAVLTSGSTSAPCGILALILRTSEASFACGALIMIALPIGKPSERATWAETTASTPPMPTVPNPPTRSDSSFRPATCTVPPSGSLSCWPMV